MSITVDLTGINSAIAKLQKKVDIKNVFDKVQPILKSEVKKAFDTETRPIDKVKWQRSKASEKREKKGGNPHTLQDTGNLYRDMQDNDNYFIDGNSIKIKTTTEYGYAHNFGQPASGDDSEYHGLAFRQFAGISTEGRQEIKRVLENEL